MRRKMGFGGCGPPKNALENMNKVIKFVSEVKIELKKVSWSTRRELMNSTIVVIVSVIILALFIGFCDLIWSNLIKFVLR